MKRLLSLSIVMLLASCSNNVQSDMSNDKMINKDLKFGYSIENTDLKLISFMYDENSFIKNDIIVKNNTNYVVSYYKVTDYYSNNDINFVVPFPHMDNLINDNNSSRKCVFTLSNEKVIYDLDVYTFMSPFSYIKDKSDYENRVFQILINSNNEFVSDFSSKNAIEVFENNNDAYLKTIGVEQFEIMNNDSKVDGIENTDYIINYDNLESIVSSDNYILFNEANDVTRALDINDDFFAEKSLIITRYLGLGQFDIDEKIIRNGNDIIFSKISINPMYNASIEREKYVAYMVDKDLINNNFIVKVYNDAFFYYNESIYQ